MTIIQIDPLETGQHPIQSQSGRSACWLDDYIEVPAHLEQRAGRAVWVPHAAIEHVMGLCFSLDLRERLAAVGDSQLNPLHGRERDICNDLTHLIHILLSSDPAVDYCSGASSPASSWYSSGVSRSAAR